MKSERRPILRRAGLLPGDFAYGEGSDWRRLPSGDGQEPGP